MASVRGQGVSPSCNWGEGGGEGVGKALSWGREARGQRQKSPSISHLEQGIKGVSNAFRANTGIDRFQVFCCEASVGEGEAV